MGNLSAGSLGTLKSFFPPKVNGGAYPKIPRHALSFYTVQRVYKLSTDKQRR